MMRSAIWLVLFLSLSGCATTHLGPQKPPEYFVVPHVRYLSEATGDFPDVIKRAVRAPLEASPGVERAYLVTVEYPDGKKSTCLCIAPASAESAKIAEAVGEAYGVIAEKGVYLDIMFLNAESAAVVERLAQPFYVRL